MLNRVSERTSAAPSGSQRHLLEAGMRNIIPPTPMKPIAACASIHSSYGPTDATAGVGERSATGTTPTAHGGVVAADRAAVSCVVVGR